MELSLACLHKGPVGGALFATHRPAHLGDAARGSCTGVDCKRLPDWGQLQPLMPASLRGQSEPHRKQHSDVLLPLWVPGTWYPTSSYVGLGERRLSSGPIFFMHPFLGAMPKTLSWWPTPKSQTALACPSATIRTLLCRAAMGLSVWNSCTPKKTCAETYGPT